MMENLIPEIRISTNQLQSLIEKNRMLKKDIRVSRQTDEITSDLIVKQFEETEKILHRFQTASSQWKTVLNSASQISIIATDTEGIITVFNTGAENLIGYSAEEIIKKQTPEIFHSASELIFHGKKLSRRLGQKVEGIDVFHQYAVTEPSRQREWTYIRKDGTRFPVNLSINPLKAPNGTLNGFLCIATDISEKKRSEEALRESEKKYRLLINNIPNVVFRGYPDGTLDIIDDKIETLTGYSKEAFLSGRVGWSDLIIEKDLKPAIAIFKKALENDNKSYVREYRIRSESGKVVWVEEVGQIICNESGKIEFITGSALDITKRKLTQEALRKTHEELEMRVEKRTTELGKANEELQAEIRERRQAEHALRESEKKYRSIFENAAGGIYQSSPEGRILTANPAFVKIMGYESEEELKKSITNLKEQFYVKQASRDELQKLFKVCGSVRDFETRFYRKDGSIIEVSLNAHEVRNEEGDILYYEGVLEDITQRKRLEELKTAKELAEASAQAKNDFLAKVSHEIRTPMNAVIGLTDLSLRKELSGRQRDYLEKIRHSSHALLRIINDILDFSKIEAGKLSLESIDFQLHSVLDNVSDMFCNRTTEKGIELVTSVADDVPCALIGDSLRLGQVLTNLTNNAVKFTDEGEIFIGVERVSREHETPVKLRFAVRDTGIGINREYLPRLFDSFCQADGSTTRKYGGTGLGLAICKRLVEMMSGEIWAESRRSGSVFYFTAEFGIQPEEKEQKQVIPEGIRGTRILVADDNRTVRGIFARVLESFGFEVTSVSSGKATLETLESAGKNLYDLILMDWMMPGIDGIAALKKIRAYQPWSQIPVIMMTGFGREEVTRQAELAGANGFLIKPVKQSLLFDAIMNVLGQGEDNGQKITGRGQQAVGSQQRMTDISLAGTRILLVEDNAINRLVATEILEEAGIIPDTAKSGREAVSAVMDFAYDAVLMDVQMPEIDGYEATKMIRDLEESEIQEPGQDTGSVVHSSRLPIIAMTAHAMKGDREKCLRAGMDDYVSKPIDTQLLFSVLTRWVSTETRNIRHKPRNKGPEIRLPDTLPGINLETAIERLGGNKNLLGKLLAEFRRDYADTADKIKEALGKGDTEFIRQLAHTIKGVAGNFSAKSLYTSSLAMEMAARRKNTDDISSLTGFFEDALEQILKSAQAVENASEPFENQLSDEGQQDIPADISEVTPMIIELFQLLEKNDLEAEECMESIKSYFTGSVLSRDIGELEDHINRLDFAGARKKLDSIASVLNVSLRESV
ncbi:PAS domain S-box protein [Desulfococcaceae bacterium HSG8]|nr:PAS domain S-box protein [Desulfococcaceae bacterium HSG8]